MTNAGSQIIILEATVNPAGKVPILNNTQELLKLLKNTKDMKSYLKTYSRTFTAVPLPVYLENLLTEKHLQKSQCIRDADLQRNYGYQIFSGQRVPSRDKILRLCISMRLTAKETHTLLCSTGYADLYPKNKRDSILIFALEKGLSVLETNELLYELQENTLE